jgi:hypothetical protein
MVGVVEQHFIQASPIKDFATLATLGEVLLLFWRQLVVFLTCHRVGAHVYPTRGRWLHAWLGVCGGTNYLEHFVRLRKHRHVAAVELIGGRAHALCHGPL